MKAAVIIAATIFGGSLIISAPAHAIPWGGDAAAPPQARAYSGYSYRAAMVARPARYAHRRARHAAYRPARQQRGFLGGFAGLSAACRSAAAQGGPCGCFAQEQLLGTSARTVNGHNLWLADTWAQVFPRTAPGPGTAAVWPHRHVAAVVSEPHGGRITVRDSWGTHDVRMAGLIFVRPR